MSQLKPTRLRRNVAHLVSRGVASASIERAGVAKRPHFELLPLETGEKGRCHTMATFYRLGLVTLALTFETNFYTHYRVEPTEEGRALFAAWDPPPPAID